MNFHDSSYAFSFALAAVSGILMALQGSVNASLGKVIGLMETTFVVHIIGSALLIVLLFLLGMGKGDWTALPEAPWYSYLGGVVSVLIIYLVAASIPGIGVSNATTAIVVGQVLTALAIDSLGWFGLAKLPFAWPQAVGIVFLAAGVKLLLRGN